MTSLSVSWRVPLRGVLRLVVSAAVLCLLTAPPTHAEPTAITSPPQPTSGPGGSDYSAGGVRVSEGGSGDSAWYVFEPVDPRPASAPLAVISHGYGEFSGYQMLAGLIHHTVRKGNVVIYPRWQASPLTPCPGPFDIEPCVRAAVDGIRGALDFLRADPTRVQPDLARTSYFGNSFGGILTANFLTRWEHYGVPRPRAVFLEDPHDGGLAGPGEPALADDLGGIPSDVLLECHSGAEGVISEEGKADSSCNAIFPKLTSLPTENKSIVLTHTDAHGTPPLSSDHGVAGGSPDPEGAVWGTIDAYDYYFVWKVWDALRNAAYYGTDREYALAGTPEHRYTGTWSDGTPVIPLKIQDHAPIRP